MNATSTTIIVDGSTAVARAFHRVAAAAVATHPRPNRHERRRAAAIDRLDDGRRCRNLCRRRYEKAV